jgi:hypothetical protein
MNQRLVNSQKTTFAIAHEAWPHALEHCRLSGGHGRGARFSAYVRRASAEGASMQRVTPVSGKVLP